MKKAVIVLSGGIDSVCMGAILKSKYDLYGITFSYGQRANQEIKSAKKIGKTLKLKEHKMIFVSIPEYCNRLRLPVLDNLVSKVF